MAKGRIGMSRLVELRISTVLLVALLTSVSAVGITAQPKPAAENKIDDKESHALIEKLGDDSFEKREAANKRLARIGEPALTFLRSPAFPNREPRRGCQGLALEALVVRCF